MVQPSWTGSADVKKAEVESRIFQLVVKHGSRKVADLAEDVGVSEVSVRRILTRLEGQGLIRRSFGEAHAYDGDDIPYRMAINYASKRSIAEKAATFVKAGDTVFLEAGSTVAILAELIKNTRDLTVVTPNLYIARLFRGTRTRVVVLGGLYQEDSESLVGPLTLANLAGFKFSKVFVGATGFTVDSGFCLNDYNRAEVTRAALMCETDSFVLADSTKFGASHIAPIGSESLPLRFVITTTGVPENCRALLERNGAEVIVCGQE